MFVLTSQEHYCREEHVQRRGVMPSETSNNFSFDIELKTLNSKFFDSKISLPSYLTNKEIEIANILKKKLFRGKVDLKINSKSNNSDSIKFNKKVIRDYFKELNEISDFDSSQLLKAVVNLPNSIDKNERNLSIKYNFK